MSKGVATTRTDAATLERLRSELQASIREWCPDSMVAAGELSARDDGYHMTAMSYSRERGFVRIPVYLSHVITLEVEGVAEVMGCIARMVREQTEKGQEGAE